MEQLTVVLLTILVVIYLLLWGGYLQKDKLCNDFNMLIGKKSTAQSFCGMRIRDVAAVEMKC